MAEVRRLTTGVVRSIFSVCIRQLWVGAAVVFSTRL
ncbi:MAG: hypothetical protein JWM95_3273 [Gemmatimonadetes bacterium]|nr:hypothetical protein [Gemmatimonadota bacterium]